MSADGNRLNLVLSIGYISGGIGRRYFENKCLSLRLGINAYR
nr:MAG TPA: hypothetical protein [Caudoviricetes sp.]